MAAPLRDILIRTGYRVRIYTPVGELIPGMGYLVRRLLENTSNTSFLRGMFAENKPFEEIIRPPSAGRIPTVSSYAADGSRNEPHIDFSVSENREKMKEAFRLIRSASGREYPLLIGGEKIMTGRLITSVDPADTDNVIGKASYAGRAEADRAVEAAKGARTAWEMTAPEARADFLFRAAEALRGKRFALAALEVSEVGKTWKDADADVAEATDYLEYYGREMLRLGRPLRLGDYPGEENDYVYVPRGIGVAISPWNFPLAIPAGMVSAAIVTGNCVIFKPSGLSPVTGWALVEAFMEAPPARGSWSSESSSTNSANG